MTTDSNRPDVMPKSLADAGDSSNRSEERGDAHHAELESDEEQFDTLRELLLGSYRTQIGALTAEMEAVQQILDDFDERINDNDGLVQMITPIIANSISTSIRDSRSEMISAISPIMADSIRTNIRDSKDEMVEALYPILGQLVRKSVAESMRELVQRIDNQIQRAFSLREFNRQLQARLRGISPAELALRESFPFEATDLFLVHKETGILLNYVGDDDINEADLIADGGDREKSGSADVAYDHDLISGMLTAIQDFVQDAFGQGEEGNLDQVTYGDKQILIESARYAYLAIVVEGTEPVAFRTKLRDCLMLIENDYVDLLREFDGNVSALSQAKEQLRPLITSSATLNPPESAGVSTSISPDDVEASPAQSTPAGVQGIPFEIPVKFLQLLFRLPVPVQIFLYLNLLIFLIWWIIV